MAKKKNCKTITRGKGRTSIIAANPSSWRLNVLWRLLARGQELPIEDLGRGGIIVMRFSVLLGRVFDGSAPRTVEIKKYYTTLFLVDKFWNIIIWTVIYEPPPPPLSHTHLLTYKPMSTSTLFYIFFLIFYPWIFFKNCGFVYKCLCTAIQHFLLTDM